MTTSRIDYIKTLLTDADWDEVESIALSTIDPIGRHRFDMIRRMNLAVAIYYVRMRRHSARFQNLLTCSATERTLTS